MRYAAPGAAFGRLALDAEQELRAHQNTLEALLYCAFEPAFPALSVVDRKNRLEIGFDDRTTIGTPGERRKNLSRAGVFVVCT